MKHPTWIEIDLNQFRRNIQTIRKIIGNSLFCLPVKANAYGHGLCGIGKAAVAYGIDCLGVSCLAEGVTLREAGIEIPILVFGAIHEDQIEGLIRYDLEFSISSKFKADLVAKQLKDTKCKVHLEVETGMQRTGVRPSTAIQLYRHLLDLRCFEVVGVYSHLACGETPEDPVSQKQIATFKELLNHIQGPLAHIANSNGVLHFPQSHLDMVRPGLLTFGYGAGVEPCFSLKSKVSYFKVVEAGSGISYGHHYRTSKQTRVVTVPIGYGDGYSRALSNRGEVLIRGKRFRISGAICMDQFMVDIGDHEVYVGDEVVLIGKQGNEEIKLTDIAALCQTIPYEILCLFNERIPRIYSK